MYTYPIENVKREKSYLLLIRLLISYYVINILAGHEKQMKSILTKITAWGIFPVLSREIMPKITILAVTTVMHRRNTILKISGIVL